MVQSHCTHPVLAGAAAALSLLLACTPLPKSIGDDELDDDGGEPTTADAGEESSGLDPSVPLWSYVLPADTMVVGLTGMPDGGVAVIEHRLEIREQHITRYDPAGAVLWRVEMDSWGIYEIAALADGRLFLGGTVRVDGDLHAATWRMSASGDVEATHVHGSSEAGGIDSVTSLAVSEAGVAYHTDQTSLEPGEAANTLWWADLELEPQWSTNDFEGSVESVGILPSGEVVTLEESPLGDGTSIVRTFTAAGAPVGDEVVPHSRFADDVPLLRIESAADGGGRIVGFGGTSSLDVLIPADPPASNRPSTHGNGAAAVATADDQLALFQVDGSGAVLRDVLLPPLSGESVSPLDVSIASDGSVYVCGYETEANIEHGFILKLPPPA